MGPGQGTQGTGRAVPWAPQALIPGVPGQDPSGNRIAQWREVTPRQGIVELSLPLPSEPALGTYTISVQGKSHSFSVEEFGTRALGSGVPPWAAGPDPLQPPWQGWHCPGSDHSVSLCLSTSAAQV